MLYRSAIAAACLCVAAAASMGATSLTSAAPAQDGSCPDQVTFAVGGTGDAHSQFVPVVPAGPRENIDYPASLAPFGGGATAIESIAVGSDQLDARARAYRANCPYTHINAQGYSLGAIVVSHVCNDWQNDRVMNRNTGCITVGNPIRPQRDGASGIVTRLLTQLVPQLPIAGDRSGGPIPVTDVCNTNDIICNAPSPIDNPLEFANGLVGYHEGDHGYTEPVPTLAGDYLYDQQPWIDNAGPTDRALATLAPVTAVLEAVHSPLSMELADISRPFTDQPARDESSQSLPVMVPALVEAAVGVASALETLTGGDGLRR